MARPFGTTNHIVLAPQIYNQVNKILNFQFHIYETHFKVNSALNR